MTKLFILTASLLCLTCEARIGESVEQCLKRYGKPTVDADRGFERLLVWDVDDIKVTCSFAGGRCFLISYTKTADFTKKQMAAILKKNLIEKCPWKKEAEGKTRGAYRDGWLAIEKDREYGHASYLPGLSGKKPTFLITSKYWREKAEKDREKKNDKTIEGL